MSGRFSAVVIAGAGLAAAACTTGGATGAVSLDPPRAVNGDDSAIAWPFLVTHGGGKTLAGFHLRVEEGADLVGVRPDAENPPIDDAAAYHWTGEVRGDEGYWTGDVVPPGGTVSLAILVRPTGEGDPRIRVVHWPTDGRDEPVGSETCEIWSFDIEDQRANQTSC
ncbi:MAG: hypothetical protein R3199_00725 [Gemmatimonadota bacterium]|nr:hypothetical protein [Gemmatimonadota bacterium]